MHFTFIGQEQLCLAYYIFKFQGEFFLLAKWENRDRATKCQKCSVEWGREIKSNGRVYFKLTSAGSMTALALIGSYSTSAGLVKNWHLYT